MEIIDITVLIQILYNNIDYNLWYKPHTASALWEVIRDTCNYDISMTEIKQA